jgi:hypothetical protein
MIPEMAREGEFLGISFDPDHIPEELFYSDGDILGGNYLRAAQLIHVEDAIARYKGPVLLIHSDTDEVVPFRCSEEAVKAYDNAQLVVIPNDTHCYDYHLELVLDAIRNWLPRL